MGKGEVAKLAQGEQTLLPISVVFREIDSKGKAGCPSLGCPQCLGGPLYYLSSALEKLLWHDWESGEDLARSAPGEANFMTASLKLERGS